MPLVCLKGMLYNSMFYLIKKEHKAIENRGLKDSMTVVLSVSPIESTLSLIVSL